MRPARYDKLILELLEKLWLIVDEVYPEQLLDEDLAGTRVQNVIRIRNRRHPHIVRPAKIVLNQDYQARISLSVPDGAGTRRIKLLAARVVWLAYHPKPITYMNVRHIDRNPANYNIWNLAPADQNDMNWHYRIQRQDDPDGDRGVGYVDDLPF